MAIKKELLKKIADAKTSVGGTPIRDGEYILVVKRILCEEKFKGMFIIPEFDVVEAEATHETVKPNPPGSDCSCAWAMDKAGKAGEAAKGNIKQFAEALLDLAGADEIMAKLGEYAGESGSEDSLRARGMLIAARTQRKKTQTGENAGKEGVYPVFFHIEGQTDEEIAARRAELDSKNR